MSARLLQEFEGDADAISEQPGGIVRVGVGARRGFEHSLGERHRLARAAFPEQRSGAGQERI